jgi:hydroxymethylglutaryl-CoA lyase
MSDLPKSIRIHEEGPREGFQIESAAIPTARKVELINALSQTGLHHMQIVSFVNPKRVPGQADAEQVVAAIDKKPGVDYTATWLNEKGLERALATGRLHIEGRVALCASENFLKRNNNKTFATQIDYNHRVLDMYKQHNIPVTRGSIMAAFGCNFEGDIKTQTVVDMVGQILDIAAQHNLDFDVIGLSDTMAWANPVQIQRVVGAVKNKYPKAKISLHLHDTRGLAVANAFAGLQMGVDMYDACVAGLGGCPFAGHKGAAGNVCTEDLVFMCDELGIETGISLEKLTECARLAEDIVGHPLPGSVMKGGSLRRLRDAVAAS